MTDTTTEAPAAATNEASANPQVVHAVQPAQMIVQADKLDEAAALLSILRDPLRFVNPNLPFAIVPKETRMEQLEHLLPAPSRVRQVNTFTDVASFLAYFAQFAPGQTPVMFAERNEKGLRVQAVFDYHANTDGRTQAKWGEHIAVLQLAYDPDFAAWMKANGNFFEQLEFAEFVEDYTHLFVNPDGATMLEVAQELKAHRNVQWQGGQRLSSGQQKLEYSETLNAQTSRGDVFVPERITVKMQIFAHIPAQELLAAFHWHLGNNKKMKFAYKFLQLRAALKIAMDSVVNTIEENTAQKVLYVLNVKNNAPNANNDF